MFQAGCVTAAAAQGRPLQPELGKRGCDAAELLAQADREKAAAAEAAERARRDAADAAERAAAEAAAAEANAEAAAADAAARFQADLEAKRARLPPEPPAGASGAVDVMVRLPGGGRASRRCGATPL